MIFALGIDARTVGFALAHKERVTVVADAADDLRTFAGATSFAGHPALQNALSVADPDLVFERSKIVTALDIVRNVDTRPRRALDLTKAKRVLVIGFAGWREWSAETVAKGLDGTVPAEPLIVRLHGADADASWHAMRARMADVHFRDEIVRVLKPRLADDVVVLFPPLLGETSTGLSMQRALGNECGVDPDRFGEALATAPSLFGEAHATRLISTLKAIAPTADLGAQMKGAEVHVFTTRAERWLSERAHHKVILHGPPLKSVGEGWLEGARWAR